MQLYADIKSLKLMIVIARARFPDDTVSVPDGVGMGKNGVSNPAKNP